MCANKFIVVVNVWSNVMDVIVVGLFSSEV